MSIAGVFQGIAVVAWLAFIVLLGMILVRGGRGQPVKGFTTLLIVLLVAAILLTSVRAGLVFLQADQYAIVVSAFQPNGYRAQALGPGLHWIIPFFENVRIYSIARQSYTMSVVAPDERSAAAGVTAIARSVGAAISPSITGVLISIPGLLSLPFFLSGGLKIIYDLSLYSGFRSIKPPEEQRD